MAKQSSNPCTYYVIMKDIIIIEDDNNPTYGSGPLEVTTDEALAKSHLAALESIRKQLEESLISQNKTIKECEISLRICTITPESNKTAERLIREFTGKPLEHLKNEHFDGSLLRRSENK